MKARRLIVWSLVASIGADGTPTPLPNELATNILPAPSGPSAIARVTYHWIDSSRAAFIDQMASERRELTIDIWYPASRGTHRPLAPYLPELGLLQRVLAESVLRRRFSPAYGLIGAGELRTHAAQGGPAHCPARGCPLLVFSHGGGVDRSFYTAQYEDLASHGYVVAAIAHTFDTHLVVFPDGRVVASAPPPRDTTPENPALPRWRRDLERAERSQAYVRRIIAVEAADIRFVIDRLARESGERARRGPLSGSLDLTRIGALGHSAGGEAAALACQLDERIKACLNQDGAMHGLPFSRDASGRTMNQPFMYFTRLIPRPVDSDSLLAAMEMTRAENDSIIDVVWEGPKRLLADIPAGAYRVLLNTPGMRHMSFSDEPLMQAVGDSVETANALRTLELVRLYTRSFFDKVLLGRADTVLDQSERVDSALVLVERYGRLRFFPLQPSGNKE